MHFINPNLLHCVILWLTVSSVWTEILSSTEDVSSIASIIVFGNNDMVLSYDPGRSNIMFVISFDANGNVLFIKVLTRRNYYHQAGINDASKRSNRWNQNLSNLVEGRSTHHLKTTNKTKMLASFAYFGAKFDQLWNAYAVTRKWSRQNFRIYSMKNSVIDTFLHKLKQHVDANGIVHQFDKHVMLYGAGTFASGGRGERLVPLKYIKKRCKYFFECHDVNEFRTLQICPDCRKCRLQQVEKEIPGHAQSVVRGLKWCPSPLYCENPLKNRDEVGAKNIRLRGLGDTNPLFDQKVHKWPSLTPHGHRFTQASECTASLLEIKSPQKFLFIHYRELKNDIDINNVLEKSNYLGFCIHSDVDVLLCGLGREYSEKAFLKIAEERDSSDIVHNASTMIPIIGAKAKRQSKTFKITDDYTARFGYSTNQMSFLPEKQIGQV